MYIFTDGLMFYCAFLIAIVVHVTVTVQRSFIYLYENA